MTNGPCDLSVPELAAAIRRRSIGAVEAVTDALARIDARDGAVNAVVARCDEEALAQAAAIDDAAAAGRPLGPCAGVPMLVKDVNNARGLPTSFGARSMADFSPPFDDHTVDAMRQAGFVIIGKTNTPEIGSLPTTEPILHGPTRNPWALDHSAGGSSGGAAAAVAAGYLPAAHGSDGAGSIRIPASCCGVVGLKPARGRVSQAPLFGDQIMGYATQGPLGRRVVDVAALLDVLQGYAPGDPYHLAPPARPYVDEVGMQPGRLRIGLLGELSWALPDDEVQIALALAVAELQRLGHTVVPLDVGLPPGTVERFLDIWSATVAATPLPPAQLEPHNQAFAQRGETLSAADLLQAFTSLQLVARAFVGACLSVDVVLAPVLMRPPLRIGELDGLPQAELTDLLARYLGICPLVNVSGQPAMSLPMHQSQDGLPIGVQLIGRPADEAGLLRLAAQLEQATGWPDSRPALAR